MSTLSSPRATLADLFRTEVRTELIAGKLVPVPPPGPLPARVALHIARLLADYAARRGVGFAFADDVGYLVPKLPSGRESFSPDAAYYIGPPPGRRNRFAEVAPVFAAEVRNENEYGVEADAACAAKRADYFAAGTLVVWDVDPLGETVTAYRAEEPDAPNVFRRGDTADAKPAVPAWRVTIAAIFTPDLTDTP